MYLSLVERLVTSAGVGQEVSLGYPTKKGQRTEGHNLRDGFGGEDKRHNLS